MKKVYQQLFVGCALIIGFAVLLGYAGNIDYAEHTILHMSQEEYDYVKQCLTAETGDEPSELEIARWWQEHQDSR